MSSTTPAPPDAREDRPRRSRAVPVRPGTVTTRFRPLDLALRRPGVQVLSVDVFDTLLCRRVPKPTDAHLLLGRSLADRGVLRPHLDARLFARLRVRAEHQARAIRQAEHGSAEVSLLDIHRVLAPAVTATLTAEQLAGLELENERAVTFPDPAVVAFLRKVRDRYRLVAVSDTYFSALELRSFFEHHRIGDLGIAQIYTSSDAGTGKGDALWKCVIDGLAVDPAAIVHAGDNADADVDAASRAGITGVHLPVSTEHVAGVLAREGVLGWEEEPSPWCDDRHGDGGLTAARRRASLLTPPLSAPGEADAVTWQSGAAVLGPVLAGFSQWVHRRAASLGAGRALCVMREGRFLKQLLDGATPEPGHRLATATMWASREGCARASIYEGSAGELRRFLQRLNTPGPRQVAASLGIHDDAGVGRLLAELDRSGLEDDAASAALLDHVLDHEDLLAAVVARSAARRRRLVAHLVDAAGPGTGPVLVVDVGWGGTLVAALQRMLDAEGVERSLHGLFVLAHIGSAGPLLDGVPMEGYLGDSGHRPFDLAGITGNPELMELACTCDEGSFLELGDDGAPVLAAQRSTSLQARQRDLLQAGIVAFQEQWRSQRDPLAGYESSPAGRTMLRRVLERFLSLPSRAEAEAFAWWGHEENFGSDTVDPMVPDAMRPTLHLRAAEDLHRSPPNELYWVGAAAALVDDETAEQVYLMRRGALRPGWLNAELGIGPAAVFLADHDGTERTVAEHELLVNRRGASFVEWEGPAAGAATALVRPAVHPAIVRVDWFEVHARDRTGATVGRRTWTPAAAGELLTVRAATALVGHVFAVDRRTRFGLAIPSPESASSLTVSMGASYLPVPGRPAEGGPLSVAGDELESLRREVEALKRTKVLRAAALPRRLYGRLRQGRRLDPR